MENIVVIIEVIYMTIIIIDYVKIFIDWYIDYRIDNKEKEKNAAVPAKTRGIN